MKPQLIVAGMALAAAGALSLAIPAAHTTHRYEVALVDTVNDTVLSLEGVSAFTSNTQPLGDVAGTSSDFYSVITSDDGGVLNPTVAAPDLLNSSDVIGANQLAGLGDTNGYLGLSPTTAGDYAFTDQEGLAFDHGLQALLTAFNSPLISYEDTLTATNATLGDPSLLNLDPAQLSDTAAASLSGDLTVAYNDFMSAADLAGITL